MIRSLRIENFALIEKAHIRFDSGFTVITGETGSGKSILLNALNLILGERANFQVIGDAKDKSVVEAEINIASFSMQDFFVANELDYFEVTIVRREIYKQGRSRAFINDIPVQLNLLKEFSSKLIHIHSQYNTLELKDKDYQLRLLDILSGNLKGRRGYNSRYAAWIQDKKQLAKLEDTLADLMQKQDYDSFQLEELLGLDLERTNYEALKEELQKIEHADVIREGFLALSEGLENELGVLDRIQRISLELQKSAMHDPKLAELQERLTSVRIELKDIADEATTGLTNDELDGAQAVAISQKLDTYNKVAFKHRTNSQEELKALMEVLSGASEDLEALEVKVKALRKEIAQEESELKALAEQLHETRVKSAPKISKAIQESLESLKLSNTVLEFRLEKTDQLSGYGVSALEIYFSPNVGLPAVPIHTAASGGELSRVMLALQNLMSRSVQLQTILFDEIDTGVSGDVAQKIGSMLREMGQWMQVIAITHLPQVAAKGGQHLLVSKEVVADKTRSSIVELNNEERLRETARLMSGDEINAAALENAKALMA